MTGHNQKFKTAQIGVKAHPFPSIDDHSPIKKREIAEVYPRTGQTVPCVMSHKEHLQQSQLNHYCDTTHHLWLWVLPFSDPPGVVLEPERRGKKATSPREVPQ